MSKSAFAILFASHVQAQEHTELRHSGKERCEEERDRREK